MKAKLFLRAFHNITKEKIILVTYTRRDYVCHRTHLFLWDLNTYTTYYLLLLLSTNSIPPSLHTPIHRVSNMMITCDLAELLPNSLHAWDYYVTSLTLSIAPQKKSFQLYTTFSVTPTCQPKVRLQLNYIAIPQEIWNSLEKMSHHSIVIHVFKNAIEWWYILL